MVKEARIRRGLKLRREGALDEAVKAYGAYVQTVLYNVLGSQGSKEDREEMLNDVFLSLWQHSGEIYPGKMKAWLAAVARNRAKTFLRQYRGEMPMDGDYLVIETDTPEDTVLEQEMKQRLLEAIHRMPPGEKEVFLRYYYHLQSIEEIADRMAIPTGTVKSRLFRGRQRLQKLLREQEG